MAQICKWPKYANGPNMQMFDFIYKRNKHNISYKCTLRYALFVDHKRSLCMCLLEIYKMYKMYFSLYLITVRWHNTTTNVKTVAYSITCNDNLEFAHRYLPWISKFVSRFPELHCVTFSKILCNNKNQEKIHPQCDITVDKHKQTTGMNDRE